MDDVALYAEGQQWLNNRHLMGRAVGFLPKVSHAKGLHSSILNQRDKLKGGVNPAPMTADGLLALTGGLGAV